LTPFMDRQNRTVQNILKKSVGLKSKFDDNKSTTSSQDQIDTIYEDLGMKKVYGTEKVKDFAKSNGTLMSSIERICEL